MSTEFKTYRIDWTPEYIRWFVDGVQIYEFLKDSGGNHSRWPFDDPAFLIVSLGVGGQFVGTIDDNALPQTMELQSVKYYRMLDHLDIPQPQIPVPNPSPEHTTVLEDGIVTFTCDDIPGHTVEWWAYGSLVDTGTILNFNTYGIPLGTYNIECVAVDNNEVKGMSVSVSYEISEPIVSLPTPTSITNTYNIPLGGNQSIELTNIPTGASAYWYFGGEAGTGTSLGVHDELVMGPPQTNNPITAQLYVRYVNGADVSDYYVVTVIIGA